jgi:hypothetical protein
LEPCELFGFSPFKQKLEKKTAEVVRPRIYIDIKKRATLDVLTNLAIKDQVWLDPSYDQREESASLHQFFSKVFGYGISPNVHVILSQ